jgi:hypothetical protein
MNRLYRFLLTLNATSLLLVVYLVKAGVTPEILRFVDNPYFKGIFYISYLIFPVALTGVIILLSKLLGEDDVKEGSIVGVEYANNAFLPSYLGYFFVALSIPNVETLIFVYSILFLFTYKSQALYFNPMFLLFGYSFYNLKRESGLEVFLISKQTFRAVKEISVGKMNRINDYTYLEP